MRPVPYYSTKIMRSGYKEKPITDIATELQRSPKSIYNWLNRRKLLKRPRYSEMEIYMLQNFPVKTVAQFIPHKSVNALKIKKSRLTQSPSISFNLPQSELPCIHVI